MKKLLDWANGCIRRWDWKNVALLKFCMLSLGVLIGLALPNRGRRLARHVCAEVFLLAWATLMVVCFRMTQPKGAADSAK